MAATGKTQFYNLPIYQPQDTVNNLTSYNTAMEIIDTNMHSNSMATQTVEDQAAGNSEAITKLQGDVSALQTSVQQAQGTAMGAINQIQELVNKVDINFVYTAGCIGECRRTDDTITVKNIRINANTNLPSLSIGAATYYIIGKLDNANPFLSNPGQIPFSASTLIVSVSSSASIAAVTNFLIYYDGRNTYLATNLNHDSFNNVCYYVPLGFTEKWNSQPRE